jgi:hypothetical protein
MVAAQGQAINSAQLRAIVRRLAAGQARATMEARVGVSVVRAPRLRTVPAAAAVAVVVAVGAIGTNRQEISSR